MIKQILFEIWEEIKTELADGVLSELQKFLGPFLETYDFVTTGVHKIKQAWTTLVNG